MFKFIWPSLSAWQRKLVIWALSLLVGYTVIGFLILPPIIRAVAVKQIARQIDREISIQKVKLNPYAFSATVDGLLIKDKDGQPFVSWDEVYVNFQLASFFGKAWVFKEISTTKPFIRAVMDQDGRFNFSDLVTKFSTNVTPAKAGSKPSILHIDRLHITGATASISDLTMHRPFTRIIGPLDVTLENFKNDPENENPYSFAGTTDAGEIFAWSGDFCLDPLRSQGQLTLNKISLNKYEPLYQDFVRFEIRGGTIGLHANYEFEFSPSNHVVAVTNTAFALRDFRLGDPGSTNDLIALPLFGVTGVNLNLEARQAEIGSVYASGASLNLQREKEKSFNLVEMAKRADIAANAPGGILFLLRSVTNAVAMLLNSTNQWRGTVHGVSFTNCALHLEDLVNVRPARLDLTDIALSVKDISNVPTTNFTAALSMRWNTNGMIHTGVAASFSPPTADISLALTNIDLGTLDPYLEPKVNLLIRDSKVGLTGQIHLRTSENELPQVTFQGDTRLDDFHTVDGALGKDLLKWDSVRVSGIAANLNPQVVSIREIAVDNVFARVVIETNKSINLLTALQPADTNARPKAKFPVLTKKAAAFTSNKLDLATAPKIAVSSIVISNAALQFSDLSVMPNVNLAISQAGGTISGISSEELQHADLNLHALIDNVGPADIAGHINPFSGTQTNQIKISVKDVDLTPASPYSGKFAGYRIARGKLNLDLEYNLVGKKLTSKNVITLDRFTFGEKVNSPDATHLPVRLGVAILKDRDGKIVLDVPVEGSIDDPELRIGKVVERAIVNLLEKVATSPFSLLGAVFGGSGEELSYQDFAPGSAELSTNNTQKLDKLVKGLYERPGLQLEIAGSVDPASDRDGLQRIALEKLLRTLKWRSIGKAEHATTMPDQMVITPAERASLVKKLFGQAQADGKITPEILAANTNLAAAVAQISSRKASDKKGAELLMQTMLANAPEVSTNTAVVVGQSKLTPPADPMEAGLRATTLISDSDFEALATDRAKAVRAYILQTGKVEDTRLFMTENQTGAVRSDGSRVYLQFQ